MEKMQTIEYNKLRIQLDMLFGEQSQYTLKKPLSLIKMGEVLGIKVREDMLSSDKYFNGDGTTEIFLNIETEVGTIIQLSLIINEDNKVIIISDVDEY